MADTVLFVDAAGLRILHEQAVQLDIVAIWAHFAMRWADAADAKLRRLKASTGAKDHGNGG